MKRDNLRKFEKRKSEQGFSLLEMMVATVIFLIITGAVYGLLEVGRLDRNRSSRKSDTMKNARASMHLIGRDLLNAGLSYHKFGGIVPDNILSDKLAIPVDTDTQRDKLTGIVAGNNVNPNVLLTDANARTDSISLVYRDVDFFKGNKINLVGATPAASADTVRVETESENLEESSVHDLYLIESASSQVLVMATAVDFDNNRIEFAPNDPLNLNQALNGTGQNASILRQCLNSADQNCTTYLASMKRVIWVGYHINNEGTLIRTVFGNNTGASASEQIRRQPLAYGVEDMQIQYLLEDGTVSDNPMAGPDGNAGTADDTAWKMNLVRQVTIKLKVRSNENDEQTGSGEYVTITSTYSTRNMRYDAG